jgi:hypothetical protein
VIADTFKLIVCVKVGDYEPSVLVENDCMFKVLDHCVFDTVTDSTDNAVLNFAGYDVQE